MTLDEDLERAREGLARAAAILRAHASDDVPYQLKGGHSPVTEADLEVDRMLRDLLPSPGDGWLSEETEDDARRLSCRRVWVVDPLDGTRSFVIGRPEYSTSIALLVDGEPVLGAIGNPATGFEVSGAMGLGTVVEGDPGLVWPRPDAVHRVLVSRSEWKRGEWAHLDAAGCTALPMGSVAYKLALVAGGAADATLTMQPKHEWDVAAGAALVRAAGGEVLAAARRASAVEPQPSAVPQLRSSQGWRPIRHRAPHPGLMSRVCVGRRPPGRSGAASEMALR